MTVVAGGSVGSLDVCVSAMPNTLILCFFLLHKVAQKVLKNAKMACHRLGQYRMPFAWAARYERPSFVFMFI